MTRQQFINIFAGRDIEKNVEYLSRIYDSITISEIQKMSFSSDEDDTNFVQRRDFSGMKLINVKIREHDISSDGKLNIGMIIELQYMHGFILVYNITDRTSFESIKTFYKKLMEARSKNKFQIGSVPIVLVGTKCDQSIKREVSYEEGLALAESWNAPFFETSVLTKKKEAVEPFQLLTEIINCCDKTNELIPRKQLRYRSFKRLTK